MGIYVNWHPHCTLSLTMTDILNLHRSHGLLNKTKTRDEIKRSLRNNSKSSDFSDQKNKTDAYTHKICQNLHLHRYKLKRADATEDTLQSPQNKLRLQLKIKASQRSWENSFIREKKRPCSKKSSALSVFRGTRTHTYTHSISKLAVESNWVTVELGLTEGRVVEHEIRVLYSSLAGERHLTETGRKGVRLLSLTGEGRKGRAFGRGGVRSQHSGCSVRWKGEERLWVNMRERQTHCDLREHP